MTGFFEDAASTLWLHAWQVTLLILAVAVTSRLVRNRYRHLMYAVWMVVLLKCLVPPVWSSTLGIFSWLGHEERVVERPIVPLYEFEAMPSPARDWSFPEPQPLTEPETPLVQSASAARTTTPVETESANDFRASLASMPLVIWLSGVGLFAVWFVVRQILIRRLVKRVCRPASDSFLLECLDRAIEQCRVRRPVQLLVGPCEFGPATFGVVRPRIIVPESLIRHGSARNLELVLGHELIHVRRWDTLHALIQTISQMLWWFHPLVWWGNRQIVRQRERCCDEEVVAALGCDPAEYAECLVNVLRSKRAAKALPGMSGLRPLEVTRQRLEMIMNFDARLHARTPRVCWLLGVVLALLLLPGAGIITATEKEGEQPGAQRLDLVESTTATQLRAASFTEMSPDGRHVYVTAWQSGAVTVYTRDPATGKLTQQQIVQSGDLSGVTDFRISSDGRIAVASCFQAETAVLFERSPVSGKLHPLDVARNGEDGVSLVWAIDVALSPDGRFAYIADARRKDRGTGDGEKHDWGRILVLSISDDGQLGFVESFAGKDRCLDGCRALVCHPDGTTLFATGRTAGTLSVLNRNPETGKLSLRQVISANDDGLSVLQGVMTPVCSPDGQFVYTASGRFTSQGGITSLAFNKNGELITVTDASEAGAQSPEGVGVFRLQSNGHLKRVQTIDVSRRKDVKLLGGNQLHVSRDGSRLYVSGTNNGSLLSFLRDKTTGELTLEQTLHHSADNHNGLNGANGIAESPDGRFLYVTGEHGNAINVLRRSGAGESKPAVSQQAGGESSVTDPKSTSPAGVTGLKLFTANGKELRELKDGEYYGLDAFFKKQVEGKTPLQQLREQQLQHLKDLNREVERATEKKQKTDGKSKPDAGAAGDGEGKPIGASLKDWGRKESDLKSGLIRIEPREHILTTIEKADLVRYLGRDAQLVLKDGRIELNGKPVAEKNLEAELKKLSPVRLTISATSTELAKHVTEIAKTAARVEIKEIRITQEEAPADE